MKYYNEALEIFRDIGAQQKKEMVLEKINIIKEKESKKHNKIDSKDMREYNVTDEDIKIALTY